MSRDWWKAAERQWLKDWNSLKTPGKYPLNVPSRGSEEEVEKKSFTLRGVMSRCEKIKQPLLTLAVGFFFFPKWMFGLNAWFWKNWIISSSKVLCDLQLLKMNEIRSFVQKLSHPSAAVVESGNIPVFQYKPLNGANMYSGHGCDNVTLICVNNKHVYDSVCTVWSTRQQWAQLAQLVFRLHKQDGNCWCRRVEVWLPHSTRWMFCAQHGATLGSWTLQILPVWVKVVKVMTSHYIFSPDSLLTSHVPAKIFRVLNKLS